MVRLPHPNLRLSLLAAPAVVLSCSLPLVSPRPEPTFPPRPVVSVPVSPIPFPTRPVATPSSTASPAPVTSGLVTKIPTPQGGVSEEWEQAVRLFQVGNVLQFRGLLGEAVQAYELSIHTYPTPEAYTFLAWTWIWMDRHELAIDTARMAIELDPDYGNPYNDIGSYLIRLGRPDEAIPWLEKAMKAERYATPHFPHLNLADVWIEKKQWRKALDACEQALLLAPDQPLPPFPTRVIGVTGPTETRIDPAMVAKVPAIEAAITAYLDAWSRRDPEAVIGMSALDSRAAVKTVMLHLAEAEVRGLPTRVEDLEVVHLSGDEAIVNILPVQGVEPVTSAYLLLLVDESWKVGAAVIDLSPEGGPQSPLS